jgi:hypothetical protein
MARQKSKYTDTIYARVTPASKAWALKQIPSRFPSLAAYVDFLIHQERLRISHRAKDERPGGL